MKIKTRVVLFSLLAFGLVVIALSAEYICPYPPNLQDYSIALQAPSKAHILGTDQFGRDILSRVMVGAKTSLFSAFFLVIMITILGTFLGMLGGYFGGGLDHIIMRISDICLAFPGVIFALAIVAVLGGSMENAVLAIGLVTWPKYARLARGQTLSLKNSNYIFVAKFSGSSNIKIIGSHILPNIFSSILITSMLDIGTMLMEIATFSFLGLGAQPPLAEWGNMMSDGRSMLQTYPWVIIAPGMAILLTVMIFNLLGDSLRDYMDPKFRAKEREKK